MLLRVELQPAMNTHCMQLLQWDGPANAGSLSLSYMPLDGKQVQTYIQGVGRNKISMVAATVAGRQDTHTRKNVHASSACQGNSRLGTPDR